MMILKAGSALYPGTPSERLRQAIEAHRDWMARETLTARWSAAPLDGEAHRAKAKVEGQELTIEQRRLRGPWCGSRLRCQGERQVTGVLGTAVAALAACSPGRTLP
jgi:hypothetical protein